MIQKKSLCANQQENSSISIEYAVESDYFAIADYFKNILNSTLHNKFDSEGLSEHECLKTKLSFNQIPSIQITQKITENMQNDEKAENNKKIDENEKNEIILEENKKIEENKEIMEKKQGDAKELKNLLNKLEEKKEITHKFEVEPSLIESVYELVENNDSESSFFTNPIQINSPLLQRSTSEQTKQKKFVITAVENKGKVNFKSKFQDKVENEISQRKKTEEFKKIELYKSISDISFDFLSFHKTLVLEKNEKDVKFSFIL